MYVVVGASGFLGSYLIKNIKERTDEEIIATGRHREDDVGVRWMTCDVSDDESIKNLADTVNRSKHARIIYLPAFFNTGSMYDRRMAWNINVVGYAKFAGMIDGFDAFYSISTDMVFSEDSEIPYREDAALSPLNDYARHKIIEETMAAAAGINVVRLPVMMGRSLSRHKKHFFDDIIEQNRHGRSMKFFTDAWRSIIDFDTAAVAILDLMESREARTCPVVHIAGDEALSKYDMALRIAEEYHLDTSMIIPVSMDEDMEIWKEKRPKKILLDNSLAKKLLHRTEMKFKLS